MNAALNAVGMLIRIVMAINWSLVEYDDAVDSSGLRKRVEQCALIIFDRCAASQPRGPWPAKG